MDNDYIDPIDLKSFGLTEEQKSNQIASPVITYTVNKNDTEEVCKLIDAISDEADKLGSEEEEEIPITMKSSPIPKKSIKNEQQQVEEVKIYDSEDEVMLNDNDKNKIKHSKLLIGLDNSDSEKIDNTYEKKNINIGSDNGKIDHSKSNKSRKRTTKNDLDRIIEKIKHRRKTKNIKAKSNHNNKTPS